MALSDAETGMPEPPPSEKHFRGDMRRLGSAIRKKWDVPQELLDKSKDRISKIVTSEESGDRDVIAAVKVVCRMVETDNGDDQHEDTGNTQVHIYIPDNGRDQCDSSSTGMTGPSSTNVDPDSGESATSTPSG